MFTSMATAFCGKCRLFRRGVWLVQQTVKRGLTEGETATALRPFYFAVHPDLFGRYPKEQSVNEESLKKLQEYLCTLQVGRQKVAPLSLVFYIRDTAAETKSQGRIREVNIPLLSQCTHETISTVLRVSNLPLDYISQLKPSERPPPWPSVTPCPYPSARSVYEAYRVPGAETFRSSWKKRVSYDTLNGWLSGNRGKAQRLQQTFAPIRKETDRLSAALKESMGVTDVKWACGWGVSQFRACLRCLLNLHEEYHHKYNIRGHTIVFGNETGVDLWGNISLGKDDITNNWLSLLQYVERHQTALSRLPKLEQRLSSLLNNISIARSTHEPVVMATEYQQQLTKMIATVEKYRATNPSSVVSGSLQGLQLVVECTSGPLIDSPSGRIHIPASCPGFLLIDFLNSHRDQAQEIQNAYTRTRDRRQRLVETCCGELGLQSLLADENISVEQFDSCCQRLLQAQADIQEHLRHGQLRVTHFYTVMSDGEMCIPWNWKSA